MVSLNYDKKRVIKLNNKTRNIIASLYIVALLMLLIGTTFSFFTVIKTANVNPAAEVKSASTNEILFEVKDKIEIYPTAANFKAGGDNISSEVTGTVKFTRNTEDFDSEKYNVILNIANNNFKYSTEEKTPELILEVTGPDGVVEEIEGLSYESVIDNKGNTINGFDITTKTGAINIATDKVITADMGSNNEATHEWKIKVTYVNLNVSQNANYEKELSGTIQIKR